MALYNIAQTDLSPSEVMDALAGGMNSMLPPHADGAPPLVRGSFRFQIHVPDEFAEIVEEAARRQGVKLIKIDEDDDDTVIREDVEFAGADTEVPDEEDDDDGA